MGKTEYIFFIMGVSGSGKTTLGQKLAGRLEIPFFDGDDFHPEANVEKMRAGIALEDQDRQAWLETLGDRIRQWLGREASAVLACSALKQAYRDKLGVNQTRIRTVYLKGSLQLLRRRIERRAQPGTLRRDDDLRRRGPGRRRR